MLILISGAANLTGKAETPVELLLSATVLQIVIFVLPPVFYGRLKRLPMIETCSIRAFTPSRIVLLISLLGVMLTGSLLINIAHLAIFSDPGAMDDVTNTFIEIGSRGGTVLTVITVCVMPALCEEFAFRGMILGDLREYRTVPAMLGSALLFSMAHFSFSSFGANLFCGFMLAAAVAVTRSLLASMVLHAAYNICAVFLLPYIQKITFEPLGTLFTVFICAGVLIIFSALALGESQAIYHEYARSRDLEHDGEDGERPSFFEGLFSVLISPTFLLSAVFFTVLTVVTT